MGPAYAGAWLAMDMIAARQGLARVVALYRADTGITHLRGAPVGAAATMDAALVQVLGVDQAAFEAQWWAYARRVAGVR